MSTETEPKSVFEGSRVCFDELVGWLEGTEAAGLDHAGLESELDRRGRELLRKMFQAQLDLRAIGETRTDVIDAEGVGHRCIEAGHTRPLATIFGTVSVTRLAYRHRAHANLYPADARLNLPQERHSHGLRRLAATESSRGSFQEATAAIGRATGQQIAKRQVESLAARAACDVGDFYDTTRRERTAPDHVVVISADGKGIVMRPTSLRPATAAAAARSNNKLATRLSKGEKRYRKRLAEVGAVYDIEPVSRSPADVMAPTSDQSPRPATPTATNKWLTASVVDDAAEVLATVFDEAERRDPDHERTWVALVDGNNHQIDRINAEAADRGIDVTVIIDFVHVLEYLWGAAWCFHPEADPTAETWVRHRALAVLNGQATQVAAGIRRRATTLNLSTPKRVKADIAAKYLVNKAQYLDYPTALTQGWPIATGVIEGACRHLVKDRMDITGARWSAQGAETILKLRAVRTNGDFDAYWRYHLHQEHERNHRTRYTNNTIPTAA